ncbi:hypothetical protein V6N12_030759 [Hibiscus sabdariffa]|uniref:Uncharacterized protein n=1 Tax=Hibiscus sabdariffa TaxID=183260 RepID=A0ABR2E6Y1_9ROSI
MKESIEGENNSANHQLELLDLNEDGEINERIQNGRKPHGSYQTNSYHGQPRSPAKENAKAKEDDNGSNSDLCVDKNDEREQRSLRLSEILGEDHDEHIGLDCFENKHDPIVGQYLSSISYPPKGSNESQLTISKCGKEWNYGKLKEKVVEDFGNLTISKI